LIDEITERGPRWWEWLETEWWEWCLCGTRARWCLRDLEESEEDEEEDEEDEDEEEEDDEDESSLSL
jgi:hypothetical protein